MVFSNSVLPHLSLPMPGQRFERIRYVMVSFCLKSKLRLTLAECDSPSYMECTINQDAASYCTWIKTPDAWGGPIELTILAKHFGVRINAYDIRTQRKDCYGGADDGVSAAVATGGTCYVVYDGIHYDALALAASSSSSEDGDITVVLPGSEEEGRSYSQVCPQPHDFPHHIEVADLGCQVQSAPSLRPSTHKLLHHLRL